MEVLDFGPILGVVEFGDANLRQFRARPAATWRIDSRRDWVYGLERSGRISALKTVFLSRPAVLQIFDGNLSLRSVTTWSWAAAEEGGRRPPWPGEGGRAAARLNHVQV